MPGKKTKERLANLQKGPSVDWISMNKCDSCSKNFQTKKPVCHQDLTCEECDFKSNVEGYI